MLSSDLNKANLPAIIGPNAVVIRFPAKYNQLCLACAEPNRTQRIQEAMRRLSGNEWSVRFETLPDQELAAINPTPTPNLQKVTPALPLLEAIKQSLDARVMKMDDGFGLTSDEVPEDMAGTEDE